MTIHDYLDQLPKLPPKWDPSRPLPPFYPVRAAEFLAEPDDAYTRDVEFEIVSCDAKDDLCPFCGKDLWVD